MADRRHKRDPVDRDILQRALDTTAALFPFFHVRAVLCGENYVMEEIPEPFLVDAGETAIAPGDPAVQGSLITVGCAGNIIRNDFYHGVTDGRGLMEFQRHLLYYYCLYRYGGNLRCPNILPAGTPPDPARYADFDDSGLSVTEVPPLRLPKERFVLPEKRRGRNEKHVVYRINLNQEEFMRFSSENDGSPAAITALLLARAVAGACFLRPGLRRAALY